MSRLGRVLVVALAAVLVVVLVAVGVVAWLAGTAHGTGWLVERALTEEMSVEAVEGRALGPLTLHGFEHRTEETETRVERIHLEWRPRALLGRRLHVTDLDVEGVTYVQRAEDPEPDPEPLELPDIRLPILVDLERARVADVSILPLDAEAPFEVREVLVHASAGESVLTVHDLTVRGDDYRGWLAGTVETLDAYPLDLRVEWDASVDDLPALAGSGAIGGSLEHLEVEHRLSDPTVVDLAATVHEPLDALRWEADVHVPRFALTRLREDLPPHEVGLDLTASGDQERARAHARLTGHVEAAGETSGELEVEYADDRLRLDALRVEMEATGGFLSAAGTVELEDPPRFALEGVWGDLAWPPVPEADYLADDGRFHVAGTTEAYSFELETLLAGNALPEGRWTVEGDGGATAADVRLTGTVLDGRIDGEGSLGWDPEVRWSAAVTGEGLNPEALDPRFTGDLALAVFSDGQVVDQGVVADARVERFDGILADLPVDVRGSFAVAPDRYEVHHLEAGYAGAEIRAHGALDGAWSGDLEADVPDLGEFSWLVEGLGGSLQLQAEVAGPKDAPHVAATLTAGELDALDYQVEGVDLVASVDVGDVEPSYVHLLAREIRAGEMEVPEVRLEARGVTADHRLDLMARGPEEFSVITALQGGLVDDRWSGTLEELVVGELPDEWLVAAAPGAPSADGEAPEPAEARAAGEETSGAERALGPWQLREPVGLHGGPDAAGLETACLTGPEGEEICLGGEWDRTLGGEAVATVVDLPLGAVSPWVPDMEVEGFVGMEASAAFGPEGELHSVDASLSSTPGVLRYEVGPGQQVEREFERIAVDGRLDDAEIEGTLLLAFTPEERFEGEFLTVRADEPEDQILTGRLHGRFDDRGITGILVPALEGTEGHLDVDLTVEGSVARPRIAGQWSFTNGAMDVIPAGIQLQEVWLEGSADGSPSWTFAGSARSGDGEVELEGSFTPPGPDAAEEPWAVEAEVLGERFEAYNTALARAVVSPDLRLRADAERVDVEGEVVVPEADITPGELEATATVSPDVQVVRGEVYEPEEVEPPLDVYGQVRVVTGDEVFIDAFGLTGRLSGSLVLDAAPDRAILGRGELQILDGEFTLYRQTLAIERGRLVFADGPVTDPGLDVRVTREADGVLAGMEIRGTASQPEAEIFSEPAMAEADALAYLTLGRPLTRASPEEGEMLGRAATAVGVAGAQQLTERIGRMWLGLDEARIEMGEDETLDEAQLVVGTQLTPSLHVGYAIGLFEATNILRIRYDLGRNWMIQTETGEESAADLLFTIER